MVIGWVFWSNSIFGPWANDILPCGGLEMGQIQGFQTLTENVFIQFIIPPASTKLKGGYTGFTLSVCPSVDRIVSALYLQQYSVDPFHICTSYQATSEGVSRVMPVSKFKFKFGEFFKFVTDFVFFWLGIQYDSMVWVIMRRRGVSSERRCSSCSSLKRFWCAYMVSVLKFSPIWDPWTNFWPLQSIRPSN